MLRNFDHYHIYMESINMALIKGHYDIVEWFSNIKTSTMLPTYLLLDKAKSQYFFPSDEVFLQAIQSSKNITTDFEIIKIIAKKGSLSLLKKVFEMRIRSWLRYANTLCLNFWDIGKIALYCGHYDIVLWLSTLSVSLPDKTISTCYSDVYPSFRKNTTPLLCMPRLGQEFDEAKRNGTAIDFLTKLNLLLVD
jgi:hypothetical protein